MEQHQPWFARLPADLRAGVQLVTQTGVAIAQSGETGAYFAVQLVGRPMSQAIDFQVSNQTGADLNYMLGEQKFALPPRYTRRHLSCTPTELKVLTDNEKELPAVSTERGMKYSIRGKGEDLTVEKSEVEVTAKP